MSNSVFDVQVRTLDITLFKHIPSMSSEEDRRSWLMIQRAVRADVDSYSYLEIGSYVGGSLQSYVVDPKCSVIYAIDKRPPEQRDDRGIEIRYANTAAAQMNEYLARFAPTEARKVLYFESDAVAVPVECVTVPPRVCFIDGEHTERAVISDFEFCLRVCHPDAAIYFHDDWVVFDGLRAVLRLLRERRVPFLARKMGGGTFAVFLRGCSAAGDPEIIAASRDAGRALWRLRTFGRMAVVLRRWSPAFLRTALRKAYRWAVK